MAVSTASEAKSAEIVGVTYGCHSRSGTIDIHLEVEELRTSGVPIKTCRSIIAMPQAATDPSKDRKAL